MNWLKRLMPSKAVATTPVAEPNAHRDHLAEFARTRQDVEAFIEPATTINNLTLLLVARDGEWTRRTVPSEKVAHKFAKAVGIPIYDVNQSGYPSAMREYNSRQQSK